MNQEQYEERTGNLARDLNRVLQGKTKRDLLDELTSDDTDWYHLVEDSSRNYDLVAEDIVSKILSLQKEKDEIAQAFTEMGWGVRDNAGGCWAFDYPLSDEEDGPYFLVSDEDCGLPEFWGDEALLGHYVDLDDCGDVESFDTVRNLVDQLRAGTAHPYWKKPTGRAQSTVARGPGTATRSDVDVINAHRQSIGMGPIDPQAGWTAQELADMAESIRKTGRMANPRERLKRRLMR